MVDVIAPRQRREMSSKNGPYYEQNQPNTGRGMRRPMWSGRAAGIRIGASGVPTRRTKFGTVIRVDAGDVTLFAD